MLRDNLVGLIEPMRISAGVDPLALSIQKQASDDRSSCLENPRPEGAESSLTENVTSPFQAEPAQNVSPGCPAGTERRTRLALAALRGEIVSSSQMLRKPVRSLNRTHFSHDQADSPEQIRQLPSRKTTRA